MSKRQGRHGKNKKTRTHRKDYDHDNAQEDDIIEFEDGFSRIRDAKGRWKKLEEGSDDEIDISDDYDDDDTDKFASAKAVFKLKTYVDTQDDNYLPLTGGTLTGNLTISGAGRPDIVIRTQTDTTQIADTFTGATDKAYIDFNDNSGSNDPGYIMHESRNSAEQNEGVLHLCPSDDNGYGDYVSIHGTNDPDKVKIHTDGTIEGLSKVKIGTTEVIGSDAKIDASKIKNVPASWLIGDTNTETTTSLSINANILKYTDEVGGTTDIDLSLYIDDTNLARLTSGTLASNGIATFKRDDNTTFTLDLSSLLDTNTWRGIQDNLTSTSTTDSLSAKQGKWLKDNKANSSHTHSEITTTNLGDDAHPLQTFNTPALWSKPAGYQTMVKATTSNGLPTAHNQSYFGYNITSRRDTGTGYSAILSGYNNNDHWITYNGTEADYPTWRKIWHDGNLTPLVIGTTATTAAKGNHTHSGYASSSHIHDKISFDSNSYVQAQDTRTRIQTNSGYLEIGPMNGSWCHLQTDRASFYLNKKMSVDGSIGIYNKHVVIETDGYIDANKIKNVPAAWLIGEGTYTLPSSVIHESELSSSTSSTSTTVAANSKAVKTAYDKGNHSHSYVPLSNGTATNLQVNGKFKLESNIYAMWHKDYVVNSSTPKEILDEDGSVLETGGAYRVVSHIDGTGTDQSSSAIFWNQNGTWKVNVTAQAGASSNHQQFHINTSGKPAIKTWHTSNYTVQVFCERMNLKEGTGTDNTSHYFGADAFMSNVAGSLVFNNNGNTNKIFHAGNDGHGSGLDADLLDGKHASDFSLSHSHPYLSTSGGTLTGDLIFNNYGLGVVGLYSSTRYQNVFSMGTSYRPSANGTSLSNMYGIAYTHTNVGGQSKAGLGHQTLFVEAGTTRCAIGNGIWSTGTITAASGMKVGTNTVWHAGNDGSGSGLDADLLDGLQLHTGRNNVANRVVRTQANGYIDCGWINTTSGDSGISNDLTRIYCSNDGYLRYLGKSDFKVLMGQTKDTYDRRDSTSDANYWTGANSWGSTGFNTLLGKGSGFIDTWSNPAQQPAGTSHWNGFQALHYTAGGNYHHGMQLVVGAGNPALTYVRGWWANGGSGYSWAKMWNSANDGHGSGLDADTVDGKHASDFSLSHSHPYLPLSGGTLTGDLTISGGAHGIKLHNSDIRSTSANPTWTGNPGTNGKIQYHSNRWYLVGGSTSNTKMITFRKDGSDKAYVSSTGEFYAQNAHKVWHAGNDGHGSGLDADLLDGKHASDFSLSHSHPYVPLGYDDTTNATAEHSKSGTWTGENATTGAWHDDYHIGGVGYLYSNTSGPDTASTHWVKYTIPTGMKTAYINHLPWSSCGYFDVMGVQADGGKVLLQRIHNYQNIQNSDEGNGSEHDGVTVAKCSGLQSYTHILIEGRKGRIHLMGIGWTKEENKEASQAVNMLHWDNLVSKPATYTPSSHTHDYAPTSHTHPYLPLSGGTLTGELTVPSYIRHAGDSDTYLRFIGADDVQMVSGGRQMFRMAEGTNPDKLRFVTDSDWTNSSGQWKLSGNVGIATNPRTDTYKLNMGGSIHMNNNSINYVTQLHFNDNVRFQDMGNDNYLKYKWGDGGAGGIRFYDGSDNHHGYLYCNSDSNIGFLDRDGQWALRIIDDTSVALGVNGADHLKVTTSTVEFNKPIVSMTSSQNLILKPRGTATTRGSVEVYPDTGTWYNDGGSIKLKGGKDSGAAGTVYYPDVELSNDSGVFKLNGQTLGHHYNQGSAPGGPSGPTINVGDTWFDTDTAILYTRVKEGTNSFWMDVSGAGQDTTFNSDITIDTVGVSVTAGIIFKEHATQNGHFYAQHEDGNSGNPSGAFANTAGYSFHFSSTEPSTNVVIDNGGKFIGTATSALYADLAEKYEADDEYPIGTILAIGGDKEVTLYQTGMKLAGVISEHPGFEMNVNEKTKSWPFIALKGRVNVSINGEAKKGDYIIADNNGKGKAIDNISTFEEHNNIIGVALEDGSNTIEVKV